jgi:DNA segregation ATPase FtsK/SpoIIIE-like protein
MTSKEPKDSLYDDAVSVFLAVDDFNTQALQRHLNIGYCRASRIMEQLKDEGVIE